MKTIGLVDQDWKIKTKKFRFLKPTALAFGANKIKLYKTHNQMIVVPFLVPVKGGLDTNWLLFKVFFFLVPNAKTIGTKWGGWC